MTATPVADVRPLLVHLVYRFDTGGLENGVVNLINHLPAPAYRHAVVALTEVVPSFAQRIQHVHRVKLIKDQKLKKVQSQIQGDAVRVSSPSRDELQQVMALLRQQDYDVDLQFGNYR